MCVCVIEIQRESVCVRVCLWGERDTGGERENEREREEFIYEHK